ncbi:MAG: hypothetical protein IMW89_17885 [Ktedonobacteraceae bacterium]|nr:hypothetical protein [Ktedonobacteraceae bacterium]
MQHKIVRIMLAVLEVLIGLLAVGGSVAILMGVMDQWLPVAWLQGTPFTGYTIPALILLIVIGGGMLLAAATIFVQREWAVLISAAMGLVMVGFEIVEALIIDRYVVGEALVPTIGQQALYFVLGLVILGLAAYLWLREYRGRHIAGRHAVSG